MTLQYSVSLRTAQVGVIESTIGTAPKLQLRTGSPPANCAAADSGTLIVEIDLPSDWLAAASAGAVAKEGAWSGTAEDDGTVAHFRIKDSAGTTTHMQGTVGEAATDMIVDNADINNGQTVTVTAFSVTAGNA